MRINIFKLREEMQRAEITQTELANKTGLSRPTINGICRGRACKTETAEKIADVLGVNIEYLRDVR